MGSTFHLNHPYLLIQKFRAKVDNQSSKKSQQKAQADTDAEIVQSLSVFLKLFGCLQLIEKDSRAGKELIAAQVEIAELRKMVAELKNQVSEKQTRNEGPVKDEVCVLLPN
jgi:hypothetical protein